jgi:hypothetical protein
MEVEVGSLCARGAKKRSVLGSGLGQGSSEAFENGLKRVCGEGMNCQGVRKKTKLSIKAGQAE